MGACAYGGVMSPRASRKTYDPRLGATNLVVAVRAATTKEHMPWLQDSDQPLVELAVRTAQGIEDTLVRRTDDPDADAAACVKAIGWLGPQLTNMLKSLGMSPVDRKALATNPATVGRLAEIRNASSRRRSSSVVDQTAS